MRAGSVVFSSDYSGQIARVLHENLALDCYREELATELYYILVSEVYRKGEVELPDAYVCAAQAVGELIRRLEKFRDELLSQS